MKFASPNRPFWMDEPDWLACVEYLPVDEPDILAQNSTALGYLFACAHLTNTRVLCQVGDPVGHGYEFFFSFDSPENRERFLDMVKQHEYFAWLGKEDFPFQVPECQELAGLHPLSAVLPEAVIEIIVSTATMITTAIFEAQDGNFQ